MSVTPHTVPLDAVLPTASPVGATAQDATRTGAARAVLRPTTWSDRTRRALLAGDLIAVSAVVAGQVLLAGGAVPTLLVAAALPLWLAAAWVRGAYRPDAWRADDAVAAELLGIAAVTTHWGIAMLLLGWVTAAVHDVQVPAAAAAWAVIATTVGAVRLLVRVHAVRRPGYRQDAIVVGDPDHAALVVRRLRRNPRLGIRVVARVEPMGQQWRVLPVEPLDRPLGHAPLDVVRALGAERVVVAGALTGCAQNDLITCLGQADVHVDIVPECALVSARMEVLELAGVPTLSAPPWSAGARKPVVLKRAFDVVVSGTALVVLAPLLLVIAVAIKLDSRGPVLFRQRRVGKDERRFEVLKFRSMRADAERRKAEVAELSFHGGGNDSGMFKIRDDPRITRAGAWLRRTSLDELPQLLNVLRGEMSLVGPRPLIDSEFCQISGELRRRITVPPGITGLWQVNGRSDVPFEEMVGLDLLYAANWSLRRDLRILARTLPAVMRGEGAY
jgi:exopolysaccharide biosynthesis polyprenyl glycosylphosphotransferase